MDDIMPQAEGEAQEPREDSIPIPPQVKYGVFIGETTDEIAEPVIVIHRSPGFERITFGHILRLLLYCAENIRAELIWEKFRSKQQPTKPRIVRP